MYQLLCVLEKYIFWRDKRLKQKRKNLMKTCNTKKLSDACIQKPIFWDHLYLLQKYICISEADRYSLWGRSAGHLVQCCWSKFGIKIHSQNLALSREMGIRLWVQVRRRNWPTCPNFHIQHTTNQSQSLLEIELLPVSSMRPPHLRHNSLTQQLLARLNP